MDKCKFTIGKNKDLKKKNKKYGTLRIYNCSCCNDKILLYLYNDKYYKYCPYCGKEIEVEE